jgi:hypothetical protein
MARTEPVFDQARWSRSSLEAVAACKEVKASTTTLESGWVGNSHALAQSVLIKYE